MLKRPHLVGRLDSAVGEGLIVLQAPAGYGKTALLKQFAADLDFRVRWLTLDRACRTREVLAERMARALALNEECPQPATAARNDDLKGYLSRILQQAVAECASPLMLIVDNAHEIAEEEDGLELVEWLLSAIPEGAEVVLSGRTALPIPEVDRRIAGGACLLLGREDLAFSPEEVRDFVSANAAQIDGESIFAATDGWPIGVVAAVVGAVTTESGRKLEAGGAWERYLASELWHSVPAALQAPLLILALPRALDSATGETLLGIDRWREVSSWLQAHDGLLLEPAVDERFRFNALLRPFMLGLLRKDRQRFEEHGASVLRLVEERDGAHDAIDLAMELDLRGPLSEMLERLGSEFILQGAFSTFIHAFESLKSARAVRGPLLRALYARALAHSQRPAEAIAEADAVLAMHGLTDAVVVHASVGKQRALRMFGRFEDMAAAVRAMQAAIGSDDHWALAETAYAEAEIEGIAAGNLTFAAERLRLAIDHAARAECGPLELFARSALGQCLAMQGNGPVAIEELTRAARGWRGVPGSAHLGVVLNNLGMAHCLVGDYESAISVLNEAVHEGQACQNARNEAFAVASLGEASLALNRFEDAKKQFEEAIRLCAESVTDESLAAQSIASLAGVHLGLGDLQQADYFAKRAWWIAEERCGPLEQAICHVQQARIAAANGEYSESTTYFESAIAGFAQADARAALAGAQYGLASTLFRGRNRARAVEVLDEMFPALSQPWMVGGLLPLARENPLFAEWAASRPGAPAALKAAIASQQHATLPAASETPLAGFPIVRATSLGSMSVTMGGQTVVDESWESIRAKELFFLLLANRGGLRKEDAVERLFPGIPAEKCNSAFHSNVYRIRRALYPDSVVKQSGAYALNPDGRFEWDVEEFEELIERAHRLTPGSEERATLCQEAVGRYRGPFAEAFYSEWAETLRLRTATHSHEALAIVAGFHAGRGEFEEAAACVAVLFEADRYNDEAAYELALYQARSGNAMGAIGHLDQYRRWYVAELGTPPPERFAVLRQKISSGVAI